MRSLPPRTIVPLTLPRTLSHRSGSIMIAGPFVGTPPPLHECIALAVSTRRYNGARPTRENPREGRGIEDFWDAALIPRASEKLVEARVLRSPSVTRPLHRQVGRLNPADRNRPFAILDRPRGSRRGRDYVGPGRGARSNARPRRPKTAVRRRIAPALALALLPAHRAPVGARTRRTRQARRLPAARPAATPSVARP